MEKVTTTCDALNKEIATSDCVYVAGSSIGEHRSPRILRARTEDNKLQGLTLDGWIGLPLDAEYINGNLHTLEIT